MTNRKNGDNWHINIVLQLEDYFKEIGYLTLFSDIGRKHIPDLLLYSPKVKPHIIWVEVEKRGHLTEKRQRSIERILRRVDGSLKIYLGERSHSLDLDWLVDGEAYPEADYGKRKKPNLGVDHLLHYHVPYEETTVTYCLKVEPALARVLKMKGSNWIRRVLLEKLKRREKQIGESS